MADQAPITPRAKDYAQWYQDVIREAELAEPALVVKGCMVIRPHGFAIWERMQQDLDRRFKATGHKNAYFPLLIPLSFLAKEAQHVEGFAMECAVVTHAGLKASGGKLELKNELEEPYVIRPTSETIIGHFFAKWIDSYRDLPLLLNQWANVMRWELRTRLFLRTSEFLWQEGHTAHASHEEARAEVARMLDVYRDFCRELVAMPVVRGVKTANERFAGAVETRTIEGLMQDGKALQCGTSHDLGQNFGRAFGVTFQNEKGEREHVWQTSWGMTTRMLGALIMAHSDDDGLVLPPRLAPIHVAVVPIWRNDAERARVLAAADKVAAELREDGLEVAVDARDGLSPGAKYFHWERRGVPLRLEIGPRDLDSGQVTAKKRVAPLDARGKPGKEALPLSDLGPRVGKLLDVFQEELYQRALERQRRDTVYADDWEQFRAVFAGEGSKFVYAHWDGATDTELAIKDETKATIRCLPLVEDGPPLEMNQPGKCVKTGRPSAQRVLFAKNY
jgi:prolyl-tRNA synthetase